MAYADQQASGNKIVSLVIVALIHIVVIYALVTGLAYSAVKTVAEKLNVVDVEEEVIEPEEPPPPPPDQPITPPPVVTPPPIVRTPPTTAPVITTTNTPPPVFIPQPVAAPPPAPPAPPPPPSKASGASPRGNPGSWATPNDYPARALREERAGTTRFRVTIGPDGRVTNCEITGSSGHADLDEATCKNVTRRARFKPALDAAGNAISDTYSNAVRWEIPK
ncbi:MULTISPECIES: energy transducer TonB [Pseudomonadota]|jgi:protein TonB|uniref:Energy transducer TonB n=2 Tax=Sphingomonadaceae TaxID=41297 RepID=A0A7V8RFI3_9SPHN|nr:MULTISPECIES: energy transducer TonB [Pseudomonadota]MAF62880.1 energy transducer TonB [Blastomonas sp.]OHC96190.1 MAG: energy transducer TonB [Sphingomonadales bacterium RIFCSPHIGHO2_01_FULL_65_20]MBA1375522.1 energy transducer TonB [Sphingomonas ursincola]MBY0620873.1 TonB family protein [Sphingomonas ursincola]MCH2236611.1 TonB family protein [Blastomonas sp.]|tara:strand:+ start:168742 stop:169404 length:663 start_codon:yes stop_codon:yes gene_type:complete